MYSVAWFEEPEIPSRGGGGPNTRRSGLKNLLQAILKGGVLFQKKMRRDYVGNLGTLIAFKRGGGMISTKGGKLVRQREVRFNGTSQMGGKHTCKVEKEASSKRPHIGKKRDEDTRIKKRKEIKGDVL